MSKSQSKAFDSKCISNQPKLFTHQAMAGIHLELHGLLQLGQTSLESHRSKQEKLGCHTIFCIQVLHELLSRSPHDSLCLPCLVALVIWSPQQPG